MSMDASKQDVFAVIENFNRLKIFKLEAQHQVVFHVESFAVNVTTPVKRLITKEAILRPAFIPFTYLLNDELEILVC